MPYQSARDKEPEMMIEQELNSRNCFDFNPEKGDYLQLYHAANPDKVFRFKCTGKHWEACIPDRFNDKLIVDQGEVKIKS